jgi:hypothetical protein
VARLGRWQPATLAGYPEPVPLLGTVVLLTDTGAADGTLRGDMDPTDVMRVINSIWYLPGGPEWRDSVGKMLGLVIDGLRYGVHDRAPRTR